MPPKYLLIVSKEHQHHDPVRVPYASVVLADSPVAYWRLGEASGNPQDSAGANNVSSVTGAPVYAVTGLLVDDPNAAVGLGGAAAFRVPDASDFDVGNGPFSIEAWLRRGAIGATHGIVAKGNGSYYLRLDGADDKVHLVLDNVADLAASDTAIDATDIHHIVCTYAGSNGAVAFYLDGAPDGSGDVVCNFANVAYQLSIGNDLINAGEFFVGTLDEVCFYDYALTADQVAAHYLAGTT